MLGFTLGPLRVNLGLTRGLLLVFSLNIFYLIVLLSVITTTCYSKDTLSVCLMGLLLIRVFALGLLWVYLRFNLGRLSKSHDKLRLNPKVKPGFSLSLLSDRLGLIGTVNNSNKKQCQAIKSKYRTSTCIN